MSILENIREKQQTVMFDIFQAQTNVDMTEYLYFLAIGITFPKKIYCKQEVLFIKINYFRFIIDLF